ncbi:MAG: AMP-binding protein, partial [Burkholderiales bacterium]|nr:AMP-binding protein [Burkholderiales bacterium]
MTEDFAYGHSSRGPNALAGYVGVPMPGVERRMASDGELLIRSPAMFKGYFKSPEQTASAFTDDGFFKTGDMAMVNAEGQLRLTGRNKESFKTSKGKFVAPAPMESLLCASPSVEFAIVTGSGQSSAYAIVVPAEELRPKLTNPHQRQVFEVDMHSLLNHINAHVAHHEQLRMIVVSLHPWTVENGCLTPTMKIKRLAIESRILPHQINQWFEQSQKVIWDASSPRWP